MIGLVIVVLGALMASFSYNWAKRAMAGESILSPAFSKCPCCEKRLKILDLTPILSYIWLNGGCRYCEAKIGPGHLIGEISLPLLYLLGYKILGLGLDYFLYIGVLTTLFAMVITDLEGLVVINEHLALLTLFSLVGLVHSYWKGGFSLWLGLIQMFFLALAYFLSKAENPWMGEGDLIILSLCLSFFELRLGLWFLGLCSWLGAVLAIYLRIVKGKRLIPMVPAIWFSFILVYLAGRFI